MSLLQHARTCLANQVANKSYNAFISRATEEQLLRVVPDGENASTQRPLEGKLIAIKDNICTTDFPTTAASRILHEFPSPYDATVVSKLRDAGGVVAGKTNLDEFGMGSHSIHSHVGPVSQPSSMEHGEGQLSVGGSSGGSALAVATDQCWASLGTDTGGSVRLPAAYTGVYGFKPSYGLLSRWGVLAYANSLDTVGILAKDVDSVKSLFHAVNGYDKKDPTSLAESSRRRITELVEQRKRSGRYRIGVPKEYNTSGIDPKIKSAWRATLKALQSKGHSIHPVSLPATKLALPAYYVLAPAEAASNLAKYDGVRYGTRSSGPDTSGGVLFSQTRSEGFGDEVKRRILLGNYSLSAEAIDNYFIQAQKVRRLVQRDFDGVFSLRNSLVDEGGDGEGEGERVDALLVPTAPTLPPLVKDVKRQDPVAAYMNDVFTVPTSLAGLPAISVPVKTDHGAARSQIGMQIISQYGDDELVLEIAQCLSES
ncbi:glutamyl-tRNA amidotransferas-like protein [Eremomyces bilateralis CBS 781.70]|uniref:Glutamyl-tRNA(Gln) amidotransferase subunit A, mitochondrial n=1 Tax=Eremomyces bilateralis CBS 781.70 TaxID=1392243 RepID=A0A6G1G4E4_9PEZI|nr:glutamyl-tRNA amidotransferas-like protein [Eremomyces bilateralis CBS 781.70]KAF1812965.1 glutamyl-tRNA amidotransferas-like protein [Eremomyces bilateralis CBS 781.70]